MSPLLLIFLPTTVALENAALGKPSQQVSDYLSTSGQSSKAVDGNPDGNFIHGSCTHTKLPEGETTWWKVDLMSFYKVTSVELFTRSDCCGNRLEQFEVRVSLSNPTTFPSTEGQQCLNRSAAVPDSGLSQNCTQPITGRYVSLYKSTHTVLTICELRVLAEKAGVLAVRGNDSSPSVSLKFLPTTSVVQCGTSCSFSVVLQNVRLLSQVQRSLQAATATRCAQRCGQTLDCFGFNFVTSSAAPNNSVTCELLGFVKFVAFQDWSPTLSPEKGWRVYAKLEKLPDF